MQKAIDAGTARLNGSGRLLVRPSGTEPVIRVMAEGDDPIAVEQIVDEMLARALSPKPLRKHPSVV